MILNITGHVYDKIIYDDGSFKVIESHNLVVNGATKLIASLLSGIGSGLTYWAVGSGAVAWDTTVVNPIISEAKLTSEIGRKLINSIQFIDNSGNVSNTPTNKIKINAIFGNDECNGTWREFGIFGGDATSTKDSGIMFDKMHHGAYGKNNKMLIERSIIFIINLK